MAAIFRVVIFIIGLFFPYLAYSSNLSTDPVPNEIRDVVIVGGGVSGLYSGYRLVSSAHSCKTCQALLKNNSHLSLKVEIYEMSNRTGGRIWSVKIPGTEHLIAEIGAMRLLEFQENIVNLIKELHLDYKTFDDTYNLMYFRGHLFGINDTVPYLLPVSMRGLIPEEILNQMFYKNFHISMQPFDDAKIKRFLANKQMMGQSYVDWSTENLLFKQFDTETVSFITDILKSPGPLFDSVTAYSLLSNIARPVTRKILTVAGGVQRVPDALADEFQKKGGIIHKNTKLYTFSMVHVNGENLIKLELGPPDLHHPNQIIFTKNLILAMPKKSLSLLHPIPSIFNQEFLHNMDSVSAFPLSKIFLTFSHPWWEQLKIKNGESASELPLQSTFYFGHEQTKSKATVALLLASYNSGPALVFWKNYFTRNSFDDSNRDANAFYNNHLPQNMSTELTRQLSLLHNENIPAYMGAIYMNWDQNPYGGGVHSWKLHVKPWVMAPLMRSPFKDMPVYIIGEAYSSYQGWVEGAINSAELLLEQKFGMEKAPWIPANYDLGF